MTDLIEMLCRCVCCVPKPKEDDPEGERGSSVRGTGDEMRVCGRRRACCLLLLVLLLQINLQRRMGEIK